MEKEKTAKKAGDRPLWEARTMGRKEDSKDR